MLSFREAIRIFQQYKCQHNMEHNEMAKLSPLIRVQGSLESKRSKALKNLLDKIIEEENGIHILK